MKTEIYWIDLPGPGRLAIMPRPRGDDWLQGEIDSLKQMGVQSLVSMLTAEEESHYGLTREGPTAQQKGLRFHSHPVPDHQVPESPESAWTMARALAGEFREGRAIAVHCFAGIGRSSLMLACILISLGLDAESAWAKLSEARGFEVPDTREQRDWVLRGP